MRDTNWAANTPSIAIMAKGNFGPVSMLMPRSLRWGAGPGRPGADSKEQVLPVEFLLRLRLGTDQPNNSFREEPIAPIAQRQWQAVRYHARLNQTRLVLAFGG